MKIVVIGGTGLVGSQVVSKLAEHGHEAIAASPNTGVNTLTGEGLSEVAEGRRRRRRRLQLALVRGRGGARVLPDVDRQPAGRGEGGGRGPSRRALGGRHRPHVRQGLLPRQGRAGEADPRLRTPVLDRARDAVLRVHQEHRRRWRPTATRSAFRRSCSSRSPPRTSPRPSAGPRSARRSTGSSRSAARISTGWTSSSARRCRPRAIRARSSADPDALYFGDYAVDDSTLVPGDGALIGDVHFRDWLERQLAAA